MELKLKGKNYCALFAAGNECESDNDNNVNDIISTIKDTKWHFPVVTWNYRNVFR